MYLRGVLYQGQLYMMKINSTAQISTLNKDFFLKLPEHILAVRYHQIS